MADQQGFITSFDGAKLFYRFWENPSSQSYDKVLLILHGIAYHTGLYLEKFREFLSPLGIPLYAMDSRGHGHSGRERGVLDSPAAIMQDLDAMVSFLKRKYPDKKLFLAGESMGGLFAIAYTGTCLSKLSGLILIAPGLIIHRDQICHPETFQVLPKALLKPGTPTVNIVGSRLEMGTRDPEFIKKRRKDELALSKVSLKYLLTLAKIDCLWEKRYPRNIQIPTLILQGLRDRALNPKGASKLYDLISSKDKERVIFPQAFHTLLWDPDTPRVFEAISEWLRQH